MNGDVSNRNPAYTTQREAEWDACERAYQGEGAIKAAGEQYLPMPSGFRGMEDKGAAAYDSYAKRAQFPEIMAPSVGAMVGIVHGTEITIEMPEAMQYLHEDADGDGLTLVDLHRRLTRELLVLGRVGVLADAPESGGNPFLAMYGARSIINWDKDFFVLDETGPRRDGFTWQVKQQFRVLKLDERRYVQTRYDADGNPTDITPLGIGGAFLDAVPFAVVSAKDVGARIETPPLMGVSRASIAMYQLSADYRHQLFMSGQETLVFINAEAPDVVGAGVTWQLQGSEGLPVDAKYVSPACTGITAHKDAIAMNRDAAAQAGARLFDQGDRAQESGEARALRYRSETANLQSVAQMSCAVLEKGLRFIARMLGLNEAEVIVNPPENLLEGAMTPAEAVELATLVTNGHISYETFYERLQKGGIASPERDSDEETDLIEGSVDGNAVP